MRPKVHDEDEDVFYGFIDETCVFSKDDIGQWSNGLEKYPSIS